MDVPLPMYRASPAVGFFRFFPSFQQQQQQILLLLFKKV